MTIYDRDMTLGEFVLCFLISTFGTLVVSILHWKYFGKGKKELPPPLIRSIYKSYIISSFYTLFISCIYLAVIYFFLNELYLTYQFLFVDYLFFHICVFCATVNFIAVWVLHISENDEYNLSDYFRFF
ncbi:MAG: hypothetical protein LBP59_19065 [Planctomycetaceae bacterium]|jgi:hypothetical protein|nr:hypothetical protein [Planctomycetaceae bacterium]